MKTIWSMVLIAGLGISVPALAGVGLSPGFTYQGQLRDNGVPVNGEVDMIFRLFSLEVGGGQTGPTLTFDNVAADRIVVENGLFQATLDFGVEEFGFSDRWLEISVRTPPGVGGYEVLSPRQRVSPTPVALQTRGMFVTEVQNVGIGTLGPDARLHVAGGTDAEPAGGGFVQIGSSNLTNLALDSNEIMARDNGTTATLLLNADGGNVTLVQGGVGNVGIGSGSPATKLHVGTGTDATAVAGGFLQLGLSDGFNLAFDNNEILARNNGASSFLALNAPGGNIHMIQNGVGSVGIGNANPQTKLHVTEGTDAEPDGGGYIMAGGIGGQNVVFDENEIMARNNGATATLFLNSDGGLVDVGENLNIGGNVTVGTNVTDARVSIFAPSGQGGLEVFTGDDSLALFPGGGAVGQDPSIIWSASDPLKFGTGDPDGSPFTEHVRITSTGNVGIGTPVPPVPLNVTDGSDASLADGSGYFLVGDQSILNVVIDNNEIMARNNGALSTLALNADGGNVTLIQGGSGNVGIGTTSPATKLHVDGGTDASAASGGFLQLGSSNGANLALDSNEIIARNNGAAAGIVINTDGGDIRLGTIAGTDNGDVGVGRVPTANDLEVEGTASKTVAGAFIVNSDARIKKDVQTVTNALATLNRVRLATFRYTDEYKAAHPVIEDRVHMNVIAQEFREVFPDWVKGSGEYLVNGEEILQVDPYPITIYAAAAVQELSRRVEGQADELAGLQARVAAIESVQRENAELRVHVAELAKRLAEMESRMARGGLQNIPAAGGEVAGTR